MSRLASREHPNGASRRAPPVLPVSLFEYGGRELAGQLTEVGVTGGKVRLSAALEADTVAKLVFTLPDGGPPLEVVSILVRTDPDGYAFTFVRLPVRDAERLRELAHSPRIGAALARRGSYRCPRAFGGERRRLGLRVGSLENERAIARRQEPRRIEAAAVRRVPLGHSHHGLEETIEVTDHAATDVAVPLDELRRRAISHASSVSHVRIARPRRSHRSMRACSSRGA